MLSQRVFHGGNNKAVTLIEVLIVSFVSLIILAALTLVLTTSQLSSSINSERIDLQAEVRRAIDWIERDVREAPREDLTGDSGLAPQSPSFSYLWFRIWGWDLVSHIRTFSGDSVEYVYNSATNTLTRTRWDVGGNPITVNTFSNIIEPPFYTVYNGPGDPSNVFIVGDLTSNRRLIIAITGERVVRGLPITYTLSSEIRIRNE